MYTNTIINPSLGEDWNIIPTFVIAEKYQMPDLMQAILDCILRWHSGRNSIPDFRFIRAAYELTTEGSALRKLGAWTAAICMARPKGWNFKKEELEATLKEVEGLLGDALDNIREFNGDVPKPYQMADGVPKFPFKIEKSTPNTSQLTLEVDTVILRDLRSVFILLQKHQRPLL